MRNPYRRSRSTARSNRGIHNVQRRLVQDVVSRSLAVPAAASSPAARYITSIPKPWQTGVHRTLDVNTAHALGFMLPSFLAGQHGVVDVPIAREDGVVVAQCHPSRIAA